MEKLDLIYKSIEEIKNDQKTIDKELKQIAIEVKQNTYDLNYHIKRTDISEQRLKIMEERLSFGYLMKLTVGVASGIGAISGAIYSLIKVIGLIN